MALFHQGRYPAAEAALATACVRERTDYENHRDLAAVQLALGRFRVAAEAAKRALDLQSCRPELWELWGLANFRLQQDADAYTAFTVAVTLDSTRAAASFYRAAVTARRGESRLAAADLARALALNPAWSDSVAAQPALQLLRDEPGFQKAQ
jgi:tetratricopeptide (TPR) repeat protein